MKRKTVRYSFFAVLIVLAGLSWYAYNEYNRKQKDTAALEADFTLSSKELLQFFIRNEQSANKKYLDKVIAVTGNVKSVDKDSEGTNTIIIGEPGELLAVRCTLDSTHNDEAVRIASQKTITVKGICTGFNSDEMLGSDVILSRCTIKN